MKRILFLSAVLCLSMLSNAQDIKGVSGKMTKSGVIALFGTPEKYKTETYTEGCEGKYEWYNYKNDELLLFIDGELNEYYVCTSRFTMFPNLFQGGVKVGDPFSKIESRCVRSTRFPEDPDAYDCIMNDTDAYVLVGVESGKIISFYYSCPL